jgi:hypothetical protein
MAHRSGAAGVRPRVFGAPIGFIGAPTSARERPSAPATTLKRVMLEATEVPRADAYPANTPGLVGGTRS